MESSRRSGQAADPSSRLRLPLWLLAWSVLQACGGGPESGSGGAGGARGGAMAGGPRAVQPIDVGVAPVERADVSSTYGTSATLRAEAQATVTARTRGVIQKLFVEEGDQVQANQVLAQLEDAEQRLALTRAESVHAIKQREFERQTGLLEQSIISENELELIRREFEEARLDLELAQLELERTSIRSPFDGVLVLRNLDVGAAVSDGTEIFVVADVEPLYADVNVPERHVEQLAPGQIVRLTADGMELPVQARIERLAPVVDALTGTVKVAVAVEHPVRLRPGAFVEVQIVTEVHENVLVVPRSALVAEGRRWHVYRPVGGEGSAPRTVEAVEVALGFEEADRVEISVLEAGASGRPLDVGDVVVSVGASALSDGAPITILAGPSGNSPDPKDADADTDSSTRASVETTPPARRG